MGVDDGSDVGVIVEGVDESDAGIVDHYDGLQVLSVNRIRKDTARQHTFLHLAATLRTILSLRSS